MKHIRSTNRFSAFLLFLLTLHVFAYNVALPKQELSLRLEQILCTASFMEDDSTEEAHLGEFKPPKHSFIDYSTFFPPKYLIPAFNPIVTRLFTYELFQRQAQVFLEIHVPPDSRV